MFSNLCPARTCAAGTRTCRLVDYSIAGVTARRFLAALPKDQQIARQLSTQQTRIKPPRSARITKVFSVQQRWHSHVKPATGSSFYREMKLDPTLAYIGVGSNVGDRLGNIDDSLRALRDAGIPVRRTSHLYETAPMYVEDQAPFLNAALEIEIPSGMSPHDMLAKLKTLEDQLGRQKTIDKGPRSIDLDILIFGTESVSAPDLIIPHHSMLEREFVLRPLADLIPNKELPHPKKKGKYAKVSWYLNSLKPTLDSNVVPLRSNVRYLRPNRPSRSTRLMGIINMTPDSFSDGGKNSMNPDDAALNSRLDHWLVSGVSILDIGGQSTRPKAEMVTEEEEIARVVPLIARIRRNKKFDRVAISIDTFRASVARAAIEAGADIVNDVSAGQLDPDMLKTVADLQCTIMLMHMRGDSKTMTQLCDYPKGVVTGVAEELTERLLEAERAGIPKWRIILDPGIGFAKQGYQNVQLLAGLNQLREWSAFQGYPWIVGPSRKRFLQRIIPQAYSPSNLPEKSDFLTAPAVTAAIQGGADIVRVHNQDMAAIVAIADAIYRNPTGEAGEACDHDQEPAVSLEEK